MYFAKDSDIILFKTPLDSSYRNVYDDYATTAQYADFLDRVFGLDAISITLSNAKARQDRDGEFSLIIAGYDSMDLHDYNYLQFETGNNQIKFAFITSVDSQSDGEAKSCVLHCKLDAWSNHYLEIKNYSQVNNHVRLTFDQSIPVNMGFNTDIENKPHTNITKSLPMSVLQHLQLPTSNTLRRILWLRITLVPNANMSVLGYSGTPPEAISILRDVPFTVYVPYAVYENAGNIPKMNYYLRTGTKKVDSDGFTYDSSRNASYYVSDTGHIDSIFVTNQILKCDLTFWVPFRFFTQTGNITIGSDTYDAVYVYPQSPQITEADVYRFAAPSVDVLLRAFTATMPTDARYIFSAGLSFYFNIPTTYQDFDKYNLTDRYGYIFGKYHIYEHSLNLYPYKYYTVKYGRQEKIVPIPSNSSDAIKQMQLIVQNYGRHTVNVSIVDSNEAIWFSEINNASNGEIPTYSDPANEYKAQNYYSIMLKALTSGLSALSGGVMLASGNPMGAGAVGASALGMLGIGAKLKDLEAYPQKQTNSTEYAENDLYQDEVFVLEHDLYSFNTADSERIGLDFHFNGVPIDILTSITRKYRDIFDVNYTYNCKIYGNISNSDRTELQNAFDRGVTRWHLGDLAQGRISWLTQMNKNVCNFYMQKLTSLL